MADALTVIFAGGGTGGHLYPALALADALSKERPDVQPFFVGARRGVEARVLPGRGVPHLLLPVRGLRRGEWAANFGVGAVFLTSLMTVRRTFSRLRPALVVVTGGYAGGPAGIAAVLMGVPLALQEQNASPGVTTRVLARWARQIHLAFPEAVAGLPERSRRRARVSGNPVRTPEPMDPAAARRHFGFDADAEVVLVVGGSQGSAALNRALLEMVEEVEGGGLAARRGTVLLWVTGPAHLADVERSLRELGSPGWVKVMGYLEEVPIALHAATLAVARAGAMTTSEFLAWGVPAVLVPLPTAAADHQTRNAQALEAAGAAFHLPEAELTGRRLWETVTALLSNRGGLEAMQAAARSRGRPEAAREIALALAELLPPEGGRAERRAS